MQTHIVNSQKEKKETTHKKAFDFLYEHLPKDYAAPTQEILLKSKIKVSKGVIRNVRNGKTISNIDVLNALLILAKKNKKAKESLEAQLQE